MRPAVLLIAFAFFCDLTTSLNVINKVISKNFIFIALQPFAAEFTARKTKTRYVGSKRHLFAHLALAMTVTHMSSLLTARTFTLI